MLECDFAKGLLSVRPSVRPCVCHTRKSCIHGSRYWNAFQLQRYFYLLEAKYRNPECRCSPKLRMYLREFTLAPVKAKRQPEQSTVYHRPTFVL